MTSPKVAHTQLPARVTIRCQACGATRTTVVLHDNALQRAQRCEACRGDAVIVASMPVFGCSCCG